MNVKRQAEKSTKRALTPEAEALIKAAPASKLAERREARSTAIAIGTYSIYRFDSENWAVDGPKGDTGYYPDFEYAMDYALRQQLPHRIATTAEGIIAEIRKAKTEIIAAMNESPKINENMRAALAMFSGGE